MATKQTKAATNPGGSTPAKKAAPKVDKIDDIVPSPSTRLTVYVEDENQLINGNFDENVLFYQNDKGLYFGMPGKGSKLLIGSIKKLLADGDLKQLTMA